MDQNSLNRSVKKEEQLSIEQVKGLWAEVKELDKKLKPIEIDKSKKGCCGSSKEYKKAKKNMQKAQQDAQEAVKLVDSIASNRTVSDPKNLADNMDNVFKTKSGVYSLESEHYATALNKTGLTHYALENYSKAIRYFEQALAIRRRLDSNKSKPGITTAESYNNIGMAYFNQGPGNYDQALENLENGLKARLVIYDIDKENSPEVAESFNNVGMANYAMRDYSTALANFENGLTIRLNVHSGIDHIDVAESYNNVGMAHFALGENKAALENCDAALKMRERLYDGSHHKLATSLTNVGLCLYALGDYERSLDYLERGLKIRRELSENKDDADVATSLNNIGVSYFALGEHEKAVVNLEEALEIRRRLNQTQSNHELVGESARNLGIAYFELKQWRSAAENLEEALRLRKFTQKVNELDLSDPTIAQLYRDIATSYINLNMYSKAAEYIISERASKLKQELDQEFVIRDSPQRSRGQSLAPSSKSSEREVDVKNYYKKEPVLA